MTSAGRAPDGHDRPVVVVADDEAHNLELFALILEPFDVTIIRAADGRAALEAVREHRPRLLITDLMMPRLRGDALCRRVRADPDLAATRILLATSRVLGDASACRADAVLAKPFDLDTAEKLLATFLT